MADQETPGASQGPRLTPQSELSRRLELLLDAAVAERGKRVSFREISGALAARGVKISRARWSYIKDGKGRLIRDRPLLTALADYFNVRPDYLLFVEDMETPEVEWDQRESVHSLRAANVKSFVDQTLGEVSPLAIESITDYLNRVRPLPPGAETVGGSEDSPDEPPVVP